MLIVGGEGLRIAQSMTIFGNSVENGNASKALEDKKDAGPGAESAAVGGAAAATPADGSPSAAAKKPKEPTKKELEAEAKKKVLERHVKSMQVDGEAKEFLVELHNNDLQMQDGEAKGQVAHFNPWAVNTDFAALFPGMA